MEPLPFDRLDLAAPPVATFFSPSGGVGRSSITVGFSQLLAELAEANHRIIYHDLRWRQAPVSLGAEANDVVDLADPAASVWQQALERGRQPRPTPSPQPYDIDNGREEIGL